MTVEALAVEDEVVIVAKRALEEVDVALERLAPARTEDLGADQFAYLDEHARSLDDPPPAVVKEVPVGR